MGLDTNTIIIGQIVFSLKKYSTNEAIDRYSPPTRKKGSRAGFE